MMNYTKCWQSACNNHKSYYLEHQLPVWWFRGRALPEPDRVNVALRCKSQPKKCNHKRTKQNSPERNSKVARDTAATKQNRHGNRQHNRNGKKDDFLHNVPCGLTVIMRLPVVDPGSP